jgi:lambda family phage tail tape measure protein
MREQDESLREAAEALRNLAEGPGREAAEALSGAFEAAGSRIETALSQAARTGEMDFRRMTESILRDMARVAAEAVIAGNGRGTGGVQATFNFADERGAGEARGAAELAAASALLARLVRGGGRFL